jgi:CheY-like chemotaxis protein
VPGPGCSSAPSTRHRVLVVDDNSDAATSLSFLLQMSGHEVHTASDGVEAIERAQELRPNIIFMDIGMPRMDGLEASRRIRELPFGAQIMIVALTGWGQEADRQRTRSAGMSHHLVKPISNEALQDILESVKANDGA